MPAATSSAAESWRWVVDGGWTTIVWMLPSEAVRSGIRSASTNASAAGAPPASSTASIPPPEGRRRAATAWSGCDKSIGYRTRATPGAVSRNAARRAAVAAWRSRRRASVGIPRRTRKAENGARVAPVSTWSARTAAIRSALPTTIPARTSEWPERYLVADSTTRSAPSSSGRQRTGEAKVLSTTTVAPCRCPISASAGRSATAIVGLEIVSR